MNTQRVCDRIHGEVRLSPLAGRVCATEAFQRLDQIRQLGGCAFVYPSATHTRREHSIGVSHLAKRVGIHLQTLHPTLVDDDDVLALELAGLLHDVGHGPFSHLFEEYVHETVPEWSHETMSLVIFDHLLVDPEFRRAFGASFAHRTLTENVNTIKLMIQGIEDTRDFRGATGRCERQRFLFEIVHSTSHGIDVDKLDYLQRDNLCVFGRSNAFSMNRILTSVCVVDDRIAFEESVAFEICELYSLRARMHRQVYQHRAVLVVEGLLKEFVRAIDNETGMIGEGVRDVRKYLALTEYSLLTPSRFSDACDRQRVLLHERPWLVRIPLTVALNTRPRCGECHQPVGITDSACRHCGHVGPSLGVVQADGTMTAVESSLTPASLSRRLGVEVYLSDVRFGPSSRRHDPHGRQWVTYDSLDVIPFCDKTGSRLVKVEDPSWRPDRSHERVLHAYLPKTATLKETVGATQRIIEWADTVGIVSTLS